MKTRLEKGYELFNELHGEHAGEELVAAVDGICPGYADITADFAFDCIFNRPGLSIKMRELMVISLCAALGDMQNQLRAHIEAAIKCGATQQEIVESILQASLYAGFARVTNAMLVAKEMFD